MFTFLLIVQTIVAVALCTVILLQRSEGGGLGVGGSSAGFMTARGAADFLSRATSWLGGAFIILCIALAAIAGTRNDGQSIDASIANAPIQAPAQPGPTQTAPANPAAPADNGAVPLAQ
ncbi:preprotein translocase subunit SecG [Sphingomonas glaciei]|uniref:Protein-export membrane protein SecG n=1 Tax=Sphingomonas glaciei TaxID=2938948 RepID=A0ABY5MUU4_9SPHN|nr:preprotein translocase subunit SecG [Sphingomonas glaciei]UUR08259.1 preprotein translocase subunit SecG [Sphingomonas glaciei]